METTIAPNTAERNGGKRKNWTPPRGIRLFTEERCRLRPFVVQWHFEGKKRSKHFPTAGARLDFAKSLAGEAKQLGVAAYRLDENEARDWRSFVAQIGADVPLEAVLNCWRRHGQDRPKLAVSKAVEDYLAAKKAEGLAKTTLDHYKPVLDRFTAAFGPRDVQAVTREDVAEWVAGVKGEDYTRRTSQIRARSLFQWLKINRFVTDNPCDGLKPVKIVAEEVEILTVDEARSLFAKNEQFPELCGRLALECFAGLRFSSAAQTVGADIQFAERGIVLPAKYIKTRRRQFIDGLPENLWAWLEWSKPETWTMTQGQYMFQKSQAFIRADIPHVHNACRHSFGTYHMAMHKDAARTAAVLCHTSQKMLWGHYKGKATEAQGAAYFQIRPSVETGA